QYAVEPIKNDPIKLPGRGVIMVGIPVAGIQVPSEQTRDQVNQLLPLLSWAINFFDHEAHQLSMLPQHLQLNRKLLGSSEKRRKRRSKRRTLSARSKRVRLSPAIEARRMRFTKYMCDVMNECFGQPLYPAVAVLATLLLGTDVSVDEVRGVG